MARLDKTQAIQLRRKGKSYNEISRLLVVPKSTLSVWFRDLRLSKVDRQRLMTRAQQHWAENIIRYNKSRAQEARRKTQHAISSAAKEISTLSPRELWLMGLALYWAEGGKTDRWRLRFSNTDPSMIRLMMRFSRKVCRVTQDKFSAQIQLHPHVSETQAKHFWSQATGIPYQQFIRSQRVVSRGSNGKRPSRRSPYGTLHILVTGVEARNRVMGWISGLQHYSTNGSS